jgi:hypothetical protein
MRPEGLGKWKKKFIHFIESRTRDLALVKFKLKMCVSYGLFLPVRNSIS